MDSFAFPDKTGDYAQAQTIAQTAITLPVTASTFYWDIKTQQNLELALGANLTMGAPQGWKRGRMAMLELVQTGAGSFTVTWNAAFANVSGLTLQTAANSSNILVFKCILDSTGLQRFSLISNNTSTRT